MAARKIQDEQEVIRWFEAGVTYEEMARRYREKYGIETTSAMWGNFRRRRGLERRITRDDELIPWAVKPEHRHQYPILMLRKEARRRAGLELSADDHHAVDVWIRGMARNGTVLAYDSDTERGWSYVAPRPDVDTDLIRVPDVADGKRSTG